MAARIIVVGAGISGLTAAWRLQQHGADVTVLEQADHVGGRMHSITRGGFQVNRGAGVYSGSYTSLLSLVDELGLGDRITTPPNAIGVVKDGEVHYLRGDGTGALVDLARSRLITRRSKLVLLRLVLDAYRSRSRTGYSDSQGRAELDTESVEQYCERRLNRELFERFVGPVLSGVWVLDARKMSVAELYFLLTKFFVGGLRGYRGGVDFVARELAERLDVRTGAHVTNVERRPDHARVSWHTHGREHTETVDGVVLSMAAPHVPPVYPGLEPELQAIMLEGIAQASYGTLRIALKRRPDANASFVCVPSGELPAIGSVAFEHVISPTAAPPGKGMLAVFLSHDWASTRMDLDDEAWIDAVLPDLDVIVPGVADLVEFIEISRWEPATIRSQLGTHKLIAQLDAAFDDDRRVQHAGDYLSIASIEGSVVAGERAAERLASTINTAAC